MSDGHDEAIGSVADEAAKLLGAFTDWAAGATGGAAQQIDEHLATGAPECQLCPICRTVHVIREAGPEVRIHLAAAAASLMQAAAGLLAAAAQTPERPDPRSTERRVRRIDVDDDTEEDAGNAGAPEEGP